MQTEIFRLEEAKGFILYERAKTRAKGFAPWPKYFITGEKYYQEFSRKRAARSEFKKLTKN